MHNSLARSDPILSHQSLGRGQEQPGGVVYVHNRMCVLHVSKCCLGEFLPKRESIMPKDPSERRENSRLYAMARPTAPPAAATGFTNSPPRKQNKIFFSCLSMVCPITVVRSYLLRALTSWTTFGFTHTPNSMS